jgi:hypothetical protein
MSRTVLSKGSRMTITVPKRLRRKSPPRRATATKNTTFLKSLCIKSSKQSNLSSEVSPTQLHTSVFGPCPWPTVSSPVSSCRKQSEGVYSQQTRSSSHWECTSSSTSRWESSWPWTQWSASCTLSDCSGSNSTANFSRPMEESSCRCHSRARCRPTRSS